MPQAARKPHPQPGVRDPEVEHYIDSRSDFHRPLLQHTRAFLWQTLPMLGEAIRFGGPFYYHHGMLLYLGLQKDHIYIGFCSGAELSNHHGLLVATDRKLIRHYRIYSPADLQHEDLPWILHEATLINEEKARTGQPIFKLLRKPKA